MAKLAAKHRFILALIFTILNFGVLFVLLFTGIMDDKLMTFIGGMLQGIFGTILVLIFQFYFRTSSDAEKKEAEKGATNEQSTGSN